MTALPHPEEIAAALIATHGINARNIAAQILSATLGKPRETTPTPAPPSNRPRWPAPLRRTQE